MTRKGAGRLRQSKQKGILNQKKKSQKNFLIIVLILLGGTIPIFLLS